MRLVNVNANYGWSGGNRSAIIEIPDEVNIEEAVKDWVMKGITWNWEVINED